jgi:hypothetical protein
LIAEKSDEGSEIRKQRKKTSASRKTAELFNDPDEVLCKDKLDVDLDTELKLLEPEKKMYIIIWLSLSRKKTFWNFFWDFFLKMFHENAERSVAISE